MLSCLTHYRKSAKFALLVGFTFYGIYFGNLIVAQNLTPSVVLQEIIAEQCTWQDSICQQGFFPSYFTGKRKRKKLQRDNNMFYPALIARTLLEHRTYFSREEQAEIDSVLGRVLLGLPSFRNAKGRRTYNFWPTDSTFVFYYNGSKKEKRKLPDDLDDTVLALLISDAPLDVATQVHKHMQDYTNRKGKRVRGAAPQYRKFETYSTWYGKRFPVVFDVSVLLNVLDFVYQYDLSHTMADSAACDLIQTMLLREDHLHKPKTISPYYPQSSLILYHLSRIIDRHNPTFLREHRESLVRQSRRLLRASDDSLERCILKLTLAKLGDRTELGTEKFTLNEIRSAEFSFFYGNAPSYFPNIVRKPLDWLNLLEYRHYSESHNLSLLLEFLIYSEE